MRPARLSTVLFALLLVYLPLHARSRQLTVLGKLTQTSAANGDSSTWFLQLNPVIIVGGRQLSSLEIKTPHPQRLASLQDEFVQAKGTLLATGAGALDVPVFELSSVHSVKYNNPAKDQDKPKSSLWSSITAFFS
ncbi:MAG TPA: hypothetical protein VMH31_09505 [Methylomirabilota bacterium]|nr:hypothetical protein [Methylomirabilota bacterium]